MKTNDIDLAKIPEMARSYAIECNAAGRMVSVKEFSKRLGKSTQWLSTPYTDVAKMARRIVLSEWASIGVKSATRLSVAIAEINEVKPPKDWRILNHSWPHHRELPRILSTPGRRQMFAHIRAEYGIAAAMRYAYICANPPAKGADRNCAQVRGGQNAVV